MNFARKIKGEGSGISPIITVIAVLLLFAAYAAAIDHYNADEPQAKIAANRG